MNRELSLDAGKFNPIDIGKYVHLFTSSSSTLTSLNLLSRRYSQTLIPLDHFDLPLWTELQVTQPSSAHLQPFATPESFHGNSGLYGR